MASEYTDISIEAVDSSEQEFEESPPEELANNLTYLYQSAKSFYNEISDVWAKIQNIDYAEKLRYEIKDLTKKEKETEAAVVQQKLEEFHYEMVSKQEFQDFMTKVFSFQEVVNGVLGQQVQMVYVYVGRDGSPELYKVSNTGNHLKQQLASRGRGMIARYGSLSKKFLDAHGEQIKNSLNDNGQKNLDIAYKETVRRGKYSRQKLNIGFLLVLWKPAEVWLKMKISSLGDINEAYAAFYLNMVFNNFIFRDNGGLEWLINTFLLHDEYGVAAVDSISGFLEGDVTIGNIEYAIKSKGATSLSPNQVVDLAKAIAAMSSPEELTMKYLTDLKKQKHDQGVRRNVAEALDPHIGKTIDEILNDLGQKYGFRSQKK